MHAFFSHKPFIHTGVVFAVLSRDASVVLAPPVEAAVGHAQELGTALHVNLVVLDGL